MTLCHHSWSDVTSPSDNHTCRQLEAGHPGPHRCVCGAEERPVLHSGDTVKITGTFHSTLEYDAALAALAENSSQTTARWQCSRCGQGITAAATLVYVDGKVHITADPQPAYDHEAECGDDA